MSDFIIHFSTSAMSWLITAGLPPGPAPAGVADPSGDGGGAGLIGGVSNLMAAALSTAGAYAQAEILTSFEQPLTRLAGLIYLVCVGTALMLAATQGAYKKALYLLVGPALFYYAITVRTDVMGTQLRIGDRVAGSIPDQIQFLRENVNSATYNGSARVSRVFLGFDALTTSVVQGVVGRILDTDNQEDILLRARERVFSWVIHGLPAEGPFVRLLALGNYGKCAYLNSIAIQIHNEKILTINNPFGGGVLFDLYTPRGYILIAEYNTLKVEPLELDAQSTWLLDSYPRIQNEYRERNVTCENVWRWTGIVARELATEMLNPARLRELYGHNAPVDQSLPWDRIMQEVRRTLQGGPHGGNLRPEDVLAAYLIRNAVAHNPLDRLTQDMFSRAPFQPDRASNIIHRLGEAESYGAYMKIQYVAGAIPYLQGLLLYLLSIGFPFFALFLVMPGRASSFFLWFSLWAWVKSWDIGFAMVDVARKVLWQFMGHGTNAFRENIDWNRPETIYSLITHNDPIVTHNTYLQLMALLTCAVPFVTGHFCLGATNLFDFVKLTVDQNANKFGQQRAREVRRALVTSPAERYRDEQIARAGLESAERARRYYLQHGRMDPQIAEAAQRMGLDPTSNPAIVGAGGGFAGRANPGMRLARPGGDMTLQRVMALGNAVGRANFHFSAEGQRLHQWLGVSAGRLSTFSYGMGETYLNAFTQNLLMHNFNGVDPGYGHTQGWASSRIPLTDPFQSLAAPRTQGGGE